MSQKMPGHMWRKAYAMPVGMAELAECTYDSGPSAVPKGYECMWLTRLFACSTIK